MKEVVKELETLGLLIKTEPIKHEVGHSERTGVIIEPMIKKQWFVKMDKLAKMLIDNQNTDDKVNFIPNRYEKILMKGWMEDCHDWCISRQLWWGHRIPVWYCGDCGEIIVSKTDIKECSKCKSKNIKQDEDVLDTWFSSWLWAFSTFGWPKDNEELKYARENKIPFLGICLGMQMAVVEFARDVLGLEDANSEEFDENTKNPVIHIMDDQKNIENKGGTMRLGSYPCILKEGTKAFELYGKKEIAERHRHRFEYNNDYKQKMEEAGLICSGTSPDGRLVEIVELKEHPFFVAGQFHPEFKSRPNRPAPLFKGLIAAAKK